MQGIFPGGITDTILRLGAALVIGSVLGLNRELHGKAAGLRTHALVCLGAAVAALISLQSPTGMIPSDANAIGRIIQGILTGIGFLGAGVILRDPAGHVTGLTTAATIWICAVLGVACGLGYWLILGVALSLTLIALLLGHAVERIAARVFKRSQIEPPDHSV
jgi:putative Mg2+ transporter-C (MgtC) family protein